jgi:hypothetical protein
VAAHERAARPEAPVPAHSPRSGAAPAEAAGPASSVLRLQRAVGNAQVRRMLAQRAASAEGGEVDPEVEGAIRGARGGGQALDPSTRGAMEAAFGADFGGVRLHTGAQADTLSRALGARAFTTGSDVFFREGELAPGTAAGRELLAHELTHVVQQGGSGSAVQPKLVVGPADDEYEREADRVARQVVSSPAAPPVQASRVPAEAGALRRAPAAAPAAPARAEEAAKAAGDSKKEGEKKEPPAPTPESLTTEVAALLAGITDRKLKVHWAPLAEQIRSPRTTVLETAANAKAAYPGLWAEEMVKKLDTLTADQRKTVAGSVFGQLQEAVTGVKLETLETEYASLGAAGGHVEEKLAGYAAMRGPVLRKFGTLKAAKGYYDTLVPANFPSAGSRVAGSTGTLVHPEMQRRLAKAAALLASRRTPDGSATLLEMIEKQMRMVGGFNVRENRNIEAPKPMELSDHSLGWAIDIDWEVNPNTSYKKFPRTLQEGLTGDDLYEGPAAQGLRKGGTMDELLPHARTFRAASDTFKAAFESESALRGALRGYLAGKGLPLADAEAAGLFALVGDGEKKVEERQQAVAAWLADRKAALDLSAAIAAQQRAAAASVPPAAWEWAPPRLAPPLWAPPSPSPLLPGFRELPSGTRLPLAAAAAEPVPEWAPPSWDPATGRPSATPPWLPGVTPAAAPTPAPPAAAGTAAAPAAKVAAGAKPAAKGRGAAAKEPPAPPAPKPEDRWGEVGAVTAFLFEAWQLFQTAAPGGKKVKQEAAGSREGIAAHGFVNLPAELVAALTASDGGGLNWLGDVGRVGTNWKKEPIWGTKDFMHFELHSTDAPKLPYEAPPKPAAEKKTAKAGEKPEAEVAVPVVVPVIPLVPVESPR